MRLWVCWIFKLSGDDGARDLPSKRIGFGDGATHALCARSEHKFCAVDLHQFAAFNGHRIRHHDDDAIAKIRANRRKTNASIAAGWLNDRAAGSKLAIRLCLADHGKRNAVLHAASWIISFKLGKNARICVLFASKFGEFNDWCVADKFGDIMINGHGKFPPTWYVCFYYTCCAHDREYFFVGNDEFHD